MKVLKPEHMQQNVIKSSSETLHALRILRSHGMSATNIQAVVIAKARLDKFWHNQDIVYDIRAQLQGTGSRSEVLSEKF